MASTRVVLPWSTWAMMAILRIVWVTGEMSFFRVRLFDAVGLGKQIKYFAAQHGTSHSISTYLTVITCW